MQRKHPLHAFAVRNAAHSESFVDAAALAADHYAGKDLDSFLVAFYDPRVHAHAVANRKHRDIAFLLLFLNGIDDLVHKLVASRAAAGAHFHSEARVLQPETGDSRTSTKHKHHQDNVQKICENLRNLWLIPIPSAPVAQLDRALASGAKGCGFDPRRAHF